MTALGVTRFLTQLKDVDPNGLPDDGVPQYQTAVSSFVVQTIAGGGGGSFSLGASNLGNTLGDTGVTGTRVVLAGIGNLTLSQATDANGGTISISAGTPVGGGGIALSASDTLFSSGTVVLTGAGGGATVNTVAPGTVQISVAAPVPQTVQTQNLFDLTAGGNTAGVLALVSSGTLTLAGGNSITLSQNGNAITISGATTSQSVQTQNLVALTLSGNTSGALALASSGTVTLAGGNNITLSQAGNAITISGANVGGAQTAISGLANSQTTYTSGTVSLSELGAITIRSTTGNQFQFSVNSQSVQPETQTFIGGISASNTLYTSGTVRFTGVGGGVTVSSNTGQRVDISVAAPVAQSVQTQNVVDVTLSGNTAGALALISSGTMTLAGGNNITVSQAGNAVTISGPNTAAQSAESQSIGMSNLGNTSGTTGIASGAQVRMLFAGGNNVTLSQSLNGASGTLTISAAAQTVESQSIGMSNIGNTSGTTGIASGGQVRFLFAGGNNITLSQSLNGASGTITISAPNLGAGAMSAGVSTMGNTAGATGVSGTQMVLVGSGVMSLSQTTGANGNTVSILAPATSVLSAVAPLSTSTNGSTISILGPAQLSVGFSTNGNTAGDTGLVSGRVVLVGTNNITLSGSTNAGSITISISGASGGGGGFSAGVSTGGNTSGATGLTGSQMVLVGSNAISLTQTTGANGGTITINAPATSSLVGVNGISISTNGSTISVSLNDALADWENFPRGQASLMTHVSAFSKTPIYWNDHIAGGILAKSAAFAISMVTASQPLSLSVHLGVYTFVNSTSVARLGSVSEAYVVSSASSVSLSGVRNIVMTGIGTHATLSSITGGEYLLGMMFSATATNAMNFSLLGASGGAGPLGAIHPGTNALSAGTSQGVQALAGRGSTTVNAMPANVVASEVINQGQGASMALHPWIYIRS